MHTNSDIPTVPGTPFAGGFYTDRINVNGVLYAIITAPKEGGEFEGAKWIDNYKNVPGALSYCDGMANTIAMAEAGSALAKQILSLELGGFKDWYLPSQDELERQYRMLKPTTDENTLYGRSGLNASSVPPNYPYERQEPAQTASEAFRAGGTEAFADEWYWSSTQHACYSDYAWCQFFHVGGQSNNVKSAAGRARAVRRFPI